MNKRGIALIAAFMVIVVLTILGSAIISQSVSERFIAQRYAESTQAFWLAEAGIQEALWELNVNNCAGCTTLENIPEWLALTGDYTGASNRYISGTLTPSGDYDAYINSENTVITAKGYSPSKDPANRMERTVKIHIAGDSLFTSAVFGANSVIMEKESRTDSYDSSQGSYGGTNISSDGDIGTNGTTAGAITLAKEVQVNGDASTGPGGTVQLAEDAEVTGTTTYNNAIDLPSVEEIGGEVLNSLKKLPSSGSITGSRTLDAGNYNFDSIRIEKEGLLTINGPTNIYVASTQDAIKIVKEADIVVNGQVTIYVNGNVEIKKEGIVNNTNPPQNFILYGTSNSKNISISKENDFYGVIYAPDAEIEIHKEGAFYGSVTGKTVTIKKETNIHYDKALKRLPGPSGYSIQEWKET